MYLFEHAGRKLFFLNQFLLHSSHKSNFKCMWQAIYNSSLQHPTQKIELPKHTFDYPHGIYRKLSYAIGPSHSEWLALKPWSAAAGQAGIFSLPYLKLPGNEPGTSCIQCLCFATELEHLQGTPMANRRQNEVIQIANILSTFSHIKK